jgi:protein-tyrosine phosphatase
MTGAAFNILFVCTGNICRSPIAEELTRRLLRERLGADVARFSVTSAGTAAIDGVRMDPHSHAALAARGLDHAASTFRARRLGEAMVADADLVLTAERFHRRHVVLLEPSALATTFSFREFVRLLDGVDRDVLAIDPVERARATVNLARQRRGSTGCVPEDADAVPDPIALAPGAHRSSAEMIDATARRLVTLLSPSDCPGRTARPRDVIYDEQDSTRTYLAQSLVDCAEHLHDVSQTSKHPAGLDHREPRRHL